MDSDRYISLSELPYVQQLARSIYLNNLNTPYRNDNSVLQFLKENQKVAKPQRQTPAIRPDVFLLNVLRRHYQPGVDLIPYGDINLDIHNIPQYIEGGKGRSSNLGFGG